MKIKFIIKIYYTKRIYYKKIKKDHYSKIEEISKNL